MKLSTIYQACKGKVIYVELSNGFFIRVSLKYFKDTINAMKKHLVNIDKCITFDVHDHLIFFKFKSGDGVSEHL